MSGWKQTIFICSMGFLIAWDCPVAVRALTEALVGFSRTYTPSLVASHPTLATDVGRQTALQDHHTSKRDQMVGRWLRRSDWSRCWPNRLVGRNQLGPTL